MHASWTHLDPSIWVPPFHALEHPLGLPHPFWAPLPLPQVAESPRTEASEGDGSVGHSAWMQAPKDIHPTHIIYPILGTPNHRCRPH